MTKKQQAKFQAALQAAHLADLEFHCRRLHPKVLQLEGELAQNGALVVRASTFIDWPPGSGPNPLDPLGKGWAFGPVRVWGTIEGGQFFLHGYDAQSHVVERRAMRIRLDVRTLGVGRNPGPPFRDREDCLTWLRDHAATCIKNDWLITRGRIGLLGGRSKGLRTEDPASAGKTIGRWCDYYQINFEEEVKKYRSH